MSKVNVKPKNIDNLDTSFSDKPLADTSPDSVKTEEQKKKEELAKVEKAILGDDPIIIQDNGKKVYARNQKTGEMIFYDANGNHVSMDVLDKLETAYGKYPDRLDLGGKKKGDVQVRFVTEKFNEEKNAVETVEVPFEECSLIAERADYVDKDGNLVESITNTIPKNHYSLVKLLRDEIKADK